MAILTSNGEIHFGQASIQRNYLIHNLYASFVDGIEESLLPIENLVPQDIEVYKEKILQTIGVFEVYVRITAKAIETHGQKNQKQVATLL